MNESKLLNGSAKLGTTLVREPYLKEAAQRALVAFLKSIKHDGFDCVVCFL